MCFLPIELKNHSEIVSDSCLFDFTDQINAIAVKQSSARKRKFSCSTTTQVPKRNKKTAGDEGNTFLFFKGYASVWQA